MDSAKGSFDGPAQSYQIGANDQITSSDDYKKLVLSYKNATPIMLKDVAKSSMASRMPSSRRG